MCYFWRRLFLYHDHSYIFGLYLFSIVGIRLCRDISGYNAYSRNNNGRLVYCNSAHIIYNWIFQNRAIKIPWYYIVMYIFAGIGWSNINEYSAKGIFWHS
jgi:hypothetical protein